MADLVVVGLQQAALTPSCASMTTVIRRYLKDRPVEDALDGAITTNTTIAVVNDGAIFRKGQVWEFDDETGEQILIKSVSGTNVTVKRGHNGSNISAHDDEAVMLLAPRFPADEVCEAISTVIDSELLAAGVFEIVEHQITSSATTNTYEAPSTECMEFLEVYQQPDPDDTPKPIVNFTRRLQNCDTSLYANGKFATIVGNFADIGDPYYVNCKHPLAVDTLNDGQQRAVEAGACTHLLEWEDIRRTAGPTNQADRTVVPGTSSKLAAYWRGQFQDALRREAAILAKLYPPHKTFLKEW